MKKAEKKIRVINLVKDDIKRNKSLIAMLVIPIIIVFVFQYLPLYGLQIAFRDYNPIGSIWESEWVGLKHFEKFIGYRGLGVLIINTLRLNVYSALLSVIPVIFSIIIKYFPSKIVSKMLQQISIMPHFISVVVLCSMVLRFFTSDGLFDAIMQLLGKESVNYLAKADYFDDIYVWSGIWQNLGYSSIIYTAALLSVPQEQHEAAKLDRTTLFQRILYIDIPYLLPIFGVNLMMQFGSILSNNYEKILLLQNTINLSKSEVLSTYVYQVAFEGIFPQYSFSTAVGLIISLVNFSLMLLTKKLVNRWNKLEE